MGTFEVIGTGGIIEGNLGTAAVNVNTDAVLEFDGDNDYMNVTTSPIYTANPDDFTISAWIYVDDVSADMNGALGQIVADAAGSDPTSGGFWLGYSDRGGTHDPTEGIAWNIKTNAGFQRGKSDDNVVSSGSWHHIALTLDGQATLYVDGVDVTNRSTDNSGTFTRTNNNLTVADDDAGNFPFNGKISDVRLYDIALSASNVQVLASKINGDSSLGAGTTNLQAWWKLNEGTGTSITDHSTNSNTGTLTNFTGTYWLFDAFSVNVQDNTTTTDGAVTVTQGKLEGLSLSSVDFDGTADYITCGDTADYTDAITISCWVNIDDITPDGDQDGLVTKHHSTSWHTSLKASVSGTLEFYINNAARATTAADVIVENRWHHLVFTYDKVAPKIYVDGVLSVTGASYTTAIGTDNVAVQLGHYISQFLNGSMRDVRLYDYALSADQTASLYSGSYNVTPDHWWKLDEGRPDEDGSEELNNAVGAFTDSGTGTVSHGQGVSLEDDSCVNGTLDLDSSLYILGNGTLSAPRGRLKIVDDFDNSGTFTHNNGQVFAFAGGNVSWFASGTSGVTFYDFNYGHNNVHSFRKACTFENSFNVSSSSTGCVDFDGTDAALTFTFGTSTAAATIATALVDATKGVRFANNGTNAITLAGASSLYPVVCTGVDWNWDSGGSGSKVKLSNIDYQIAAVTGGTGVTATLTGDCEFDGVIVSNGDTLDLNGQRAEFSALLKHEGGNGLQDGAGGAHIVTTAGINYSSNTQHSSLQNVTYIQRASDTHYLSRINFGRIALLGVSPSFGNYGPSYTAGVTDLIVGCTGTVSNLGTEGSATKTAKVDNMTIATGSTVNASNHTLTVAGDFTTSGGLIGKSALNLTGSEEVTGTDNLDEVATSNRVTVEAWFKATTDANYRAIFSRGTSWATGNIYLYMNDGGNIQFSMNDLGATVTSATAGLADGKWHHAAATYDQTTCKIYIDGKLDASAAHTNAINTQTNGFKIGDRDAQNWEGQIGRVSIWKSALTEGQIRNMMFKDWTAMAADNYHVDDNPNGFTDSDAIGWWQFDEGKDVDVEDLSSQSNDGTLNSAAWAGAGTFTEGTSTLKMTGTSKKINFEGNEGVGNLHITGTTTLNDIDGNDAYLQFNGSLVVDGTLSSTTAERLIFNSSSDQIFVPQALEFDGTSDYVDMGNVLNITGDISITFWMKTNGAWDNIWNALVCKGDNTYRVARYSTSNAIGFSLSGTDELNTSGTSAVDDSKWHHIACTYDGANKRIYVDGALETTEATTGAIDTSTQPLRIASNAQDSARAFNGSVADVRIYDAALSVGDITTLAENILPNQGRTANLVGHWKLDETSGTTATDSGSGGNNGTHAGSPTKFGNRATALAGLYSLEPFHTSGTVHIPECTTPRLKIFDGDSTAIKCTGDLTATTLLECNTGVGFNANGNTINVRQFTAGTNTTLTFSNSTLNFKVTTSGDTFSLNNGANLITGNTTISGYSSTVHTPSFLNTNHEVVGNVSNLKLYSGSDLTVIGPVTNCSFDDDISNIHQWHHTLDTQQVLDADEAGDDDMKLPRPSLDNALQLQTGG